MDGLITMLDARLVSIDILLAYKQFTLFRLKFGFSLLGTIATWIRLDLLPYYLKF